MLFCCDGVIVQVVFKAYCNVNRITHFNECCANMGCASSRIRSWLGRPIISERELKRIMPNQPDFEQLVGLFEEVIRDKQQKHEKATITASTACVMRDASLKKVAMLKSKSHPSFHQEKVAYAKLVKRAAELQKKELKMRLDVEKYERKLEVLREQMNESTDFKMLVKLQNACSKMGIESEKLLEMESRKHEVESQFHAATSMLSATQAAIDNVKAQSEGGEEVVNEVDVDADIDAYLSRQGGAESQSKSGGDANPIEVASASASSNSSTTTTTNFNSLSATLLDRDSLSLDIGELGKTDSKLQVRYEQLDPQFT